MGRITALLLRIFVRDHHNVRDTEVRVGYGFLEAWVSIAGNMLLFAVKFVFGLLTNSVTLIADAFHSLGDLVTSAIVIFGFKAMRRPPDEQHPHGHGRAEPIATLIIAILLIVAGVEFGRASIDRLMTPEKVAGSWVVIGLMLASAITKEWMARFSIELGGRIHSDMLRADAWHHRSDAIASALVIVAMVGARYGNDWLDGACGLGVAVIIIITGWQLASITVSNLMGEAPSSELVAQALAAAASVRGVQGAHDIHFHDYGAQRFAALRIDVAPGIPTEQSHDIANEVESTLARRLGVIPVVHVDLRERPSSPELAQVQEIFPEIIKDHPEIVGFHGLLYFKDEKGGYVEAHVQMRSDGTLESAHHVGHQVSEEVSRRMGGVKVNVHVEPSAAPRAAKAGHHAHGGH